VIEAMREALPVFGRQIPGYDHPDVVMTGRRNAHLLPGADHARQGFPEPQHAPGCYPAGEGAGYAGGILSARGRRDQGGRSAGHEASLSA
jgi:uncharacterized FAD-dependent dehydrogenase